MSYSALLTICVSLILGICGVATIFVTGWIKASQITCVEAKVDKEVASLRNEINQLWEKISKVEVLLNRMETVEKGIDEIKDLLRNR